MWVCSGQYYYVTHICNLKVYVILNINQDNRSWSQVTVFDNHDFPAYLEVIPSCDEMEAFKDVDVAMLVGAMPRREGMERKDLLAANVKIFKSQGQAIDKVAKKTIKVGYSIEWNIFTALVSFPWQVIMHNMSSAFVEM